MMELNVLTVGPMAANCVVVWDDKTRECIVFDAGDDGDDIARFVREKGLDCTAVIATHGHYDHVNGMNELCRAFPKAAVMLNREDEKLYQNVAFQGQVFGMRANAVPAVTRYLDEGDDLRLAGEPITVLHTPGHSPGSLSFAFTASGKGHLVCGDTIFAMGIGRSDLWGGDHATLMRAITSKLLTYPDDTVLVPGHGPSTHVGTEKKLNPFMTSHFKI